MIFKKRNNLNLFNLQHRFIRLKQYKQIIMNGSSILITGGTGSFGKAFVKIIHKKYKPKRIVIFSRDEMKQWIWPKTLRILNL